MMTQGLTVGSFSELTRLTLDTNEALFAVARELTQSFHAISRHARVRLALLHVCVTTGCAISNFATTVDRVRSLTDVHPLRNSRQLRVGRSFRTQQLARSLSIVVTSSSLHVDRHT